MRDEGPETTPKSNLHELYSTQMEFYRNEIERYLNEIDRVSNILAQEADYLSDFHARTDFRIKTPYQRLMTRYFGLEDHLKNLNDILDTNIMEYNKYARLRYPKKYKKYLYPIKK